MNGIRLLALAAGLILGLVCWTHAAEIDVAKLPPHPRLLIGADDIPAIKQRIEKLDWAKANFQKLKKSADAWLAKDIELPPRGGQWFHWYACPKHGARLKTESPTKHVCPVDGEVFTGWPYDDVVLATQHMDLASAARELGLVCQISGDDRYAEKAKEILIKYAGKYLSYPLHNNNGQEKVGGGRAHSQTLDEAMWLIRLAQGADLIWEKLTEDERQALKDRLFYPAAVDVIQKHHMQIHNIQCWKNSAVGLVGFLYGDAALISDAIDGEYGLRNQIAKGVNAQGMWFEGAWGYHFFTLEALMPLTEAAYHCGIDLYKGDDKLKGLFTAPLMLAMPDGRLPAFNDSRTTSAKGNAAYEIGLARYRDPLLAWPLRRDGRQSLPALVCGVDALPDLPRLEQISRKFDEAGYAILRSGSDQSTTWICLKYGPHGGWHGHPDKNTFVLYSNGKILADDGGTALYGVPLSKGWCKTTLAHNTLLVDESDQHEAAGSCLEFLTGDGYSAALTDAGSAIANGSFRRATFLLWQDLVVFIDLVHLDPKAGDRVMDLVYHPQGQWLTAPPGQPFNVPKKPGYSFLENVTQTDSDGIDLSIKGPNGKTNVVFAATGQSTRFLLGTGPGADTHERVPIVIARRHGNEAAYIWAVTTRALGGASAPKLTVESLSRADGKPLAESDAAAARVEYDGHAWRLLANPDRLPIQSQHGIEQGRLLIAPE